MTRFGAWGGRLSPRFTAALTRGRACPPGLGVSEHDKEHDPREVVSGDPNPANQHELCRAVELESANAPATVQRLALGFSKRVRNLDAAVSLYMAWYNFCRVHETLRCTPAMEVQLTDHVWSLAELLDVALNKRFPAPPTAAPEAPRGLSAARAKDEKRGHSPWPRNPKRDRFRAIKGGKAA